MFSGEIINGNVYQSHCLFWIIILLIKKLIKLPNETETVEFKHNNFDPEMIGSDISALANSAANRGKNQSYMVQGVNNETHDIVGTNYNRFIDNPPKSRNEILSGLMHRLKMCEELGSGWDRIALECELKQLPAPKINLYEENTKVILFSQLPFANIPHEDKLWTCYLHSCLKQVTHEGLTNSSLRQRFGLEEKSSAPISRLIKEAVEKGLIKAFDPEAAPKHMKYVPFWA